MPSFYSGADSEVKAPKALYDRLQAILSYWGGGVKKLYDNNMQYITV